MLVITQRCALVVLIFASQLLGQSKHDTVKLAGIHVEGTHLPRESVIRILGLKIGQTSNYQIMMAACDRLTKTGLVKDIDYSYEAKPDGSGVIAAFKIWDEDPLLPASVFPEENNLAMWTCLQGADPIFQKQLPNTVDALRFYVANMNQCISQTSDKPLHAEAEVICDAGKKPARIEFRIVPGTASPDNAIRQQIAEK